MSKLYILIHEFDGESRAYPIYLRGEPPSQLADLAKKLEIPYDDGYHKLTLHGGFKRREIPLVSDQEQLETEPISDFAVLVPTYYGKHDPYPKGKQEWDTPHVPVIVRNADGLQIVLGSTDYDDYSVPNIQIERQPSGWAIFLHPAGGGDPYGYFYILDDERGIFHPESAPGPELEILNKGDPIPPELYALPKTGN